MLLKQTAPGKLITHCTRRGELRDAGGTVTLASNAHLCSPRSESLSPVAEPPGTRCTFLPSCFRLCRASAQKTLGRFYHLARGWRPHGSTQVTHSAPARLHHHRPEKLKHGMTPALPDQERRCSREQRSRRVTLRKAAMPLSNVLLGTIPTSTNGSGFFPSIQSQQLVEVKMRIT